MYFIINNDWLLKHRILQIGAYFATFVFSLFFHDLILNNSNALFLLVGYGGYADSVYSITEISWAKEGGVGVYFFMMIDLWIIWCFSKFKSISSNKPAICFYNLYFLGVIFGDIDIYHTIFVTIGINMVAFYAGETGDCFVGDV